MQESLSDMLNEHEETEQSLKVLEAMDQIVARHPGASTLADVEQQTGRWWVDLLVEETGLTAEQVGAAATRVMSSDAGEGTASTDGEPTEPTA